MDKKKPSLMVRRGRSAANTAIYTFAVLGALILVNILSTSHFARIDLTQDQQYSLNDASKRMMQDLQRPLVVKAYFSEDLQPPYHTLRQRIRDMLDDYRAYSGGNLQVEIRTPGINDDVSDEASGFGIHPVPMQFTGKTAIEVKNVYAGIAFVQGDRQEVLPHIRPWDNLEYEFSSAIRKVTGEDHRRTIGFLGGHGELVDMQGVLDALRRRELLGDLYEVQAVRVTEGTPIPDDVDALVVLNPTEFISQRTQFEIDQYLMKGNPVAIMFSTATQDRQFPTPRATPVLTGLESLLSAYGVEVQRDLVVDRRDSTQMLVPTQEGLVIANNPLAIISRDLDPDHIMVRDLGALSLPFSSPISLRDDVRDRDGMQVTELIRSGPDSRTISNVQDLSSEELMQEQPGEQVGPFLLAATFQGSFESAFRGRDIPAPGSPFGDEDGGIIRPEDAERARVDQSAPTRLFVMANGEFLIQQQRFQQAGFHFFRNLIDWLVADEDLISIRTRGRSRPLEQVDAGRQDFIKYLNIVGLPLAFILLGVARFALRRRRQARMRHMATSYASMKFYKNSATGVEAQEGNNGTGEQTESAPGEEETR